MMSRLEATRVAVELAGDAPIVGGHGARSGRKVLSILAMFAGALLGTVLLLKWGFVVPLALSALLATAVTIAAVRHEANGPTSA